MGIIASIFGGPAAARDPPPATLNTEEGFVDIGLTVTHISRSRDGVTSVTARGKMNGAAAGFVIDIFPGWTPQKLEDADLLLHWGKVRYRSIGPDSDHFVGELARLYGLPVATRQMPARIDFSAVSLEGNPDELPNVRVRMKLFFESDDESGYAEVYTNLDLPAKRVEFHEKDPEYREPLVRALSEGA